jgi:hypothetical protein
MRELALKNLIHTLYHYEIIKALSAGPMEDLVDAAKQRHSKRLRRLQSMADATSFAKELQDKLLQTIEDIPDATEVEKNAVREYVDVETPL